MWGRWAVIITSTVARRPGVGSVPFSLSLAVWVVTIMAPLSSDAVLPGLPSIAEEFEIPADQAQLTIASALIGVAVGSLIVGVLSDSVGRRPPLIVGALMMAVGGAVAASAPHTVALSCATTLIGGGSAAGLVLGRAVFADLTDGPALVRQYSVLGALTGVGPMLGAVGGALIITWSSWRTVFVVLAVLAVGTLLLIVLFVPEPHPRARRTPHAIGAHLDAIRIVVGSGRFLAASGVVWFGFAAVFAYIAASPFVLQTVLGFSPVAYALVLAADGVCLLATSAIAGALAARVPPVRLTSIGLGVLGAGSALALIAVLTDQVTPWTMVSAMLLIGMSLGFVFGPITVMAVERVRPHTGSALAVMSAVQFVFAGAAAPLVGLGGDRAVLPFALVAMIATVGAVGCLVLLARLRRGQA